jgi:zinc protease
VTATADVRTEVTEGAMKEFLYELGRLGSEKVSATELADAKRSIVGGFALSLENQNLLLTNIVQRQIYDFPANYWDEYPQKIAAVTAEDVQRAAQKYFNPQTLQIVAVGDAAKIRPALEKFGNVQVIAAK